MLTRRRVLAVSGAFVAIIAARSMAARSSARLGAVSTSPRGPSGAEREQGHIRTIVLCVDRPTLHGRVYLRVEPTGRRDVSPAEQFSSYPNASFPPVFLPPGSYRAHLSDGESLLGRCEFDVRHAGQASFQVVG